MNTAWRKLWPECVDEIDFEGFEAEDTDLVDDSIIIGQSMGLEVDLDDVEDLVAEYQDNLSTKELKEK